MRNEPLVVEHVYHVPLKKVWSALTDNAEIKQWYFQLEDFKAEVGFTFTFIGGEKGGKQYLHLCEITEVVKEKKLTYSWRYDGYPGISFVTFELFSQGDKKTLLRLSHTGLESFAEGTGFGRKQFSDGWNAIIHTNFKEYLEPSQPGFTKTITVPANAHTTFAALTTGIADWWGPTEGISDKTGEKYTIHFGKTIKTFLVSKLMADKKVVWQCTEAYIDSAKLNRKDEWVGTSINWEIVPADNATTINFTHHGLSKDLECYDICEQGWDYFLESLSALLTTGKGTPYKD